MASAVNRGSVDLGFRMCSRPDVCIFFLLISIHIKYVLSCPSASQCWLTVQLQRYSTRRCSRWIRSSVSFEHSSFTLRRTSQSRSTSWPLLAMKYWRALVRGGHHLLYVRHNNSKSGETNFRGLLVWQRWRPCCSCTNCLRWAVWAGSRRREWTCGKRQRPWWRYRIEALTTYILNHVAIAHFFALARQARLLSTDTRIVAAQSLGIVEEREQGVHGEALRFSPAPENSMLYLTNLLFDRQQLFLLNYSLYLSGEAWLELENACSKCRHYCRLLQVIPIMLWVFWESRSCILHWWSSSWTRMEICAR